MIKVNARDAKIRLHALPASVEETGQTILICRSGKTVAALGPVPASPSPAPLQRHPDRRGRIRYDPMEPATEEDWPAAAR